MTIGDRIRIRREQLGLSVDDVAHRLGKHRATVYRYESDEIGSFPASILESLSIVLDTTPAYLMGWADTPAIPPLDDVSPDERALLSSFHQLNGEGQEKLLDYASDLVASGRYIKTDPHSLGAKQA